MTTDEAVREALRAGATDDPRIDALARQAAARQLRRSRWKLWLYACYLPCAVVAAFLVPEHGAERVVLVLCWLLIIICFGTSAWLLLGIRRRARRYLRNGRMS